MLLRIAGPKSPNLAQSFIMNPKILGAIGLGVWTHTTVNPFPVTLEDFILKMNRNAREPKLANHGARPNSSVMRRLKKSGCYQKWREKMTQDSDEQNPKHGHLETEEEIAEAAAKKA